MNFDKIQYFLDIVEAGSYKNAAEQKNISVSAVSQKIQAIEKQFSSKLVKKRNGKLELTKTGEVFVEKGQRILSDYHRALDALDHLHTNVIYIGVVSYVDPEFIVNILKEFHEVHPEFVLRIQVELLPIMVQKFNAGIYQALILGKTDMRKVKGYDCVDLFAFHPCILVPKEHEWSSRSEIKARELDGKKIAIIFEDEWPEGFHTICSAIEETGADVQWEIVNNYQELVCQVEMENVFGLGYDEDWVVKFLNCRKIALSGVVYEDYGIMAMRTDLNSEFKTYFMEK